MRLGLGLGVRNSGFVGGYDSATSAFLTATGITSKTESDAVNNLVIRLKSYGLWSKMKAIYPFVSDQRNLLSYTEDFGNAAWSKQQASISVDQTTAPDGTLTADKLVENTVNDTHRIFQSNIPVDITQTYTYSIYVKQAGRTAVMIRGIAGTDKYAYVNISNGTLISGNITPTITNAGNGWYRLSISFQPTGANFTPYLFLTILDNATYIGDGTSGVFVWGAQLEIGSTATTYQKTSTTASSVFVQQFKYNLKDARDLDAAFRLAFNGGWTYSKQGAKANGTSAYANTYYNTSVNSITNSNSIGFYANIANTSALSDPSSMGNVRISDLNGSTMTASGTSMSTRLNNAPIAGTISGATGLFTATRQSATVTKLFKNATQTATGNSGGVPINETVFIANSNIGGSPYAAGYVSNQFTFAHMSDGLSDSDVSNLYTSVQAFNTSLNRQV